MRYFEDSSKTEIIEVFDNLYKESKNFKEEHSTDTQQLVIIVRWIGWDFELNRKERPFILQEPIDEKTKTFNLNDGRKRN